MITQLALLTLVLATNPQTTKHRKKAPPSTTAPMATESTKDVAPGVTILRKADCVLVLKGQLTRQLSIGDSQGKPSPPDSDEPRPERRIAPNSAPRNKQTRERFEYELPGTLQEETDQNGTKIRFRFTAAADMKIAKARGSLHLEDQSQGPGKPPTVVDAIEVTGADPFVFEAGARGQGLVPVSGIVFLRGQLKESTPVGTPVTAISPLRPVVSLPLPPLVMNDGKVATPSLRFQGSSLWAWANSKSPFTVAATMDYQGRTGAGTITGSVEVSFRIGATK